VDDPERPVLVVAPLVRVVQPRGRRRHHRDREIERDVRPLLGGAGQEGPQILAVEVLHREEVLAGVLADVVDLHDVLVVQRGRDPRLGEQHADEALIARVLRSDSLEHHVALEAFEPLGSSQQHVGHPARGEVGHDPVATQVRLHLTRV
jgi:hypothetical protein